MECEVINSVWGSPGRVQNSFGMNCGLDGLLEWMEIRIYVYIHGKRKGLYKDAKSGRDRIGILKVNQAIMLKANLCPSTEENSR